MIKNYIKIAIRNFAKRRLHSVINILGLGIAITCCLLVYLFVNSELNYDKFNEQHEDIYRLNVKRKRSNGEWLEMGAAAGVMAPELAKNIPEIKSYTRLKGALGLVKIKNEYHDESYTFADPELFEIFTFPLKIGEYSSLKRDPHGVILSEEYADKHYGTIDIIGEVIEVELNGEFVPCSIRAVADDIPGNSSIQFNILFPFELFERSATGDWMTSWHAWGVPTYLLMNEGFDETALEFKLSEIMRKNFSEDRRNNLGLSVQPLTDIYLNEDVRGFSKRGSISTSWVLMAIATFILIIASINFTNLTIGMSMPRVKEFGVRKTIGAQRRNLIAQLLGETFILATLAFFIAFLLADILLPYFGKLTSTSLSISDQLDVKFYIYMIGLLGGVTLLAGGYPALLISNFDTIRSLKSQEKISNGGVIMRFLVVTQFALAVFFVIGVAVMWQQVEYFYTSDKGYDDKNIISIWIRELDNNEQVKDRIESYLATSPHISSITSYSYSNYRHIDENNNEVLIAYSRIDENYLRTMHIELFSGRDFDTGSGSDQHNSVIVNKAFLSVMDIPLEDAIGTQIPFDRLETLQNPTIVGVINDVNFESLQQEVMPRILHANSGMELKRLFVKAKDGELGDAVHDLEVAWESVLDYRPFEYEMLEDINNQAYSRQENEKQVITFAGIIAILISCLGLFALSSMYMQQRTKEVGIRKVLGANVLTLLTTLSKEFTIIIICSIGIALPLAWYVANNWLSTFAYRIDVEISLLIQVAIAVISLAYFTISYQAFRTANTNPVDALKDE